MKRKMDIISLIGVMFLFVIYFMIICQIFMICAECCEINNEIDHDFLTKKGLTDFDT